MIRTALISAALFLSTQTQAAIIEIDYNFDLNNGAVYQCVDGANTSTGTASNCWTNAWYDTSIADTLISESDTVVIDISFAEGQKLRWYDDGNSIFSEFSESLQIGLDSSVDGFQTGGIHQSFAFKDVSGAALHEQASWVLDPLSAGGGAFVHSTSSGITNLTDSYFEFSGITVEMELFNFLNYSQNSDNATVDNLTIFLTSGNFEVIESSVAVSEPATYALFLLMAIGLLTRRHSLS